MSTVRISAEALNQIPYVSYSDWRRIGPRALPTLSFFTPDQGWELWFPANADNLLKLSPAQPVEADYFAREKIESNDLFLQFLDFVAKRVLVPRMLFHLTALTHDVRNVGASLAKLDLFSVCLQNRDGIALASFAQTELEYLLIVLRSMFDLFYDFFKVLWAHVQPASVAGRLPKSLSTLLVENDAPRTGASVIAQFGLPEPIAHSFAECADFFMALRKIRDHITHHGHSIDLLMFSATDGFLINSPADDSVWFERWRIQDAQSSERIPLRPALCQTIAEVFASFDRVFAAFQELVDAPHDLVPGFGFFMRGRNVGAVVDCLENGHSVARNT